MDERREAARRICRRLTESGHRALLAGGCVRDLLLGESPKDYDIATSALPHEVAALFPRSVGVGAAFGVQVIVLPEGQFEVATFRTDGPYLDGRRPATVAFASEEEDARRRDLTINAMFLDPESDRVIDYVGGQEDLNRRVVRTVGDPYERFEEDHLRLLRAVRFAARLEFDLDPQTRAAIVALAPLIQRTSAERIRDEVLRILTEGHAKRGLMLMDEVGLLEHVLPEVARMKGVAQPPEFHPEGDVWTHTLLVLDVMGKAPATLALGALLHDVGKPVTQTFEDRIRFNNHDKVGAEITEALCKRLRMPNHDAARVTWLVDQHMRVAAIPDMRESNRKRFVRHEWFPELLELCRLDVLGSHGDTSSIEWVEDYMANLTPEETKPAPLLTGHDLIEMGYTPGPIFGEILEAIEDAQLEGVVRTREEAREIVAKQWPLGKT